ncbi:MAG: NAD-dependent epimerase/dehydratase family protein [Actinomycetota bacterium]
MSERVLVTGGFGSLGQSVLHELKDRGHHVTVLVRDKPANRRTARRLGSLVDDVVWGDVRTAYLDSLVARTDAVVHLAGMLPPHTEKAPDLAESINVGGTLRLIDAVEQAEHRPLFVFTSSLTVFGLPSLPVLRTADEPVRPSDHYTRHKVTVEERLRAGTARFSILRVAVSVDARTLSTDLGTVRQLLRTTPDNPMEYVHPADVATAVAACVRAPDAVGKVLLIGGGESCRITHHEFIDVAFGAAGLRVPRDLLGTEPFYTHWMDTAESNEILGFQQRTFSDYREEMHARLRWVRPLVRPISPVVVALLARWVRD